MSIEDDVALLERVPTLRLLGREALRVLAIGSEHREFARGDTLFRIGDEADCGYVVQRGAFRVTLEDGSSAETIAGPGTLIGELALIVPLRRPARATALEFSPVIRLAPPLFPRLLESHPAAARRLRDDLAPRTSQIASDILMAGTKLGG